MFKKWEWHMSSWLPASKQTRPNHFVHIFTSGVAISFTIHNNRANISLELRTRSLNPKSKIFPCVNWALSSQKHTNHRYLINFNKHQTDWRLMPFSHVHCCIFNYLQSLLFFFRFLLLLHYFVWCKSYYYNVYYVCSTAANDIRLC